MSASSAGKGDDCRIGDRERYEDNYEHYRRENAKAKARREELAQADEADEQ